MAAAGIFVPPAHSELALTGGEPGAFDWSSYKEEMESARHEKLKHIAMAFVLTVAALEPHSGLGVLWIGVVDYAFVHSRRLAGFSTKTRRRQGRRGLRERRGWGQA